MNEDEFASFCNDVHSRLVGALTLLCGGQRAVAEELCQEALARAYRDWHRIRHYDSPGAWVRRVAVNLARSQFRRMQAERRARGRLAGRVQTSGEDPDVAVGVTVARALRRLPEEQRTAVVLRYYLDLPIAQVAEITGRSESAVTSLTHRAVQALRQELDIELELDDPSAEEVSS